MSRSQRFGTKNEEEEFAEQISRTISAPNTGVLYEAVCSHLKDKELLLVLDNFEQIVKAAPLVSGIVESSKDVKVLITSRESLQIRGEQIYELPDSFSILRFSFSNFTDHGDNSCLGRNYSLM